MITPKRLIEIAGACLTLALFILLMLLIMLS